MSVKKRTTQSDMAETDREAAVSALRQCLLQVWMKEAGETDLVPEGQSVPFTFRQEFLQSAQNFPPQRGCKRNQRKSGKTVSVWVWMLLLTAPLLKLILMR